MVHPRDEHTNWPYTAKQPSLKTITISEKETMKLKEIWEGYIGGLKGRKGKGNHRLSHVKFNNLKKKKRTREMAQQLRVLAAPSENHGSILSTNTSII